MENQTKVSWVLFGIKPSKDEQLEEHVFQRMLSEAFIPGRMFKLYLAGAQIHKLGSLEEMESGYDIVKKEMEEYQFGDYGIISTHEEGELLFMPIELPDDVKDFSGNIDSLPA
jgi:hypothetical protein